MGFTEVLTIVFVILKLADVIAWSWWLVLLPELIALVSYIGYFAVSAVAFRRVRKHYRKMEEDFFRNL